MAAAFWRRVKANAALTWRWFQYWRKRYMWLRLAIVVLIFAEPVYGVFHPLIRDLVVIAIKGIESAKLGPRRYTDYYQFEQKKRLQKHLLTHFDANRDGRLERGEAARLRRETGLGPQQVTGTGLRAELDPLLEANHKLKLVPADVTGRTLRREALDRALAEMDRQHKESHAEIDPMMAMQYPGWRDYLKWGTWKRGLAMLRIELASQGVVERRYFRGLGPTSEPEGFYYEPPAPGWRGYTGWIGLLLLVIVSVRRCGKGEALRKRFEEDPEFALAPCPICKVPTHDYGALIANRGARAWAAAAVVGLALLALETLPRWDILPEGTSPMGMYPGAPEGSAQALVGEFLRAVTDPTIAIPVILAAGILRWFLWPREVHAVHRRPWLLTVGFGAGVVLVVGLLGTVASFTMAQYRSPRAVTTVMGGRPRAMQGPRRVPEEKRLAAMAAARTRTPQPTSRGMRGMRGRHGGGRQSDAEIRANRARRAAHRAQWERRMAERRARRGPGQRGRRGERGMRREM
jgi:hypothetical protein